MKFTIYVLSPEVKEHRAALAPDRLGGSDGYKEVTSTGIDFNARVYLQRDHETAPGWYDAIREHCRIDPAPINISNSLIVVIKTKSGRYCAVAFGQGHHALNKKYITKEYGREVAERLLNPAAIKAIDSKGIGKGALQKSNIAAIAGDLAEFTLNPNQDRIRRLAGTSPDKKLGKTLIGSTPLAVDGDLIFADLGMLCERILSHHNGKRNQRFAAYDPFRKVNDDRLIKLLNNKLDVAILRNPASIGILTVNIEDWERIAEVQVWTPGGDWLNCDGFEVISLAKVLRATSAKMPIAKVARVRAIDASSEIVFDEKLIDLVTFETEHDGKPYALSEGQWFLLHQDFKKNIEDQLQDLEVKHDPSFLPTWDLNTQSTELMYNQAVAKSKGANWLCLDQDEVTTPTSGSIEACDLLQREGTFIHVKRWDGSQKLSAHAKQGSNSGHVMRNNQEFRDGLLRKLPASWRTGKPWRDFSASFSARNHKVIIAIADGPHRNIPEDLPIFSKMTLLEECRALRAENYAVELYHIPLINKVTVKKKSKKKSGGAR